MLHLFAILLILIFVVEKVNLGAMVPQFDVNLVQEVEAKDEPEYIQSLKHFFASELEYISFERQDFDESWKNVPGYKELCHQIKHNEVIANSIVNSELDKECSSCGVKIILVNETSNEPLILLLCLIE